MAISILRPQADEYAPYFAKYVDHAPEGDLLEVLREQAMETDALLRGLPPERGDYAYAPGKWTIKEVIGHVNDVERVMAYRALTIARSPGSELPGFDENTWTPAGRFGVRTVSDLLDEFQLVRASTIQLARHLDAETLAHRGKANGNPVSVRALFYVIAGHERHHVALFRERYLS